MKKTKLILAVLGIGLVAPFALASCSESLSAGLDENEYLAEEESLFAENCAEGSGRHADFLLANDLGLGCEDGKNKLPECAVVTESGEAYPKTTTIEFDGNCKGKHGKARTGKVVIVQTDDMKVEGATRTITFEHFGMENNSMKGQKIIENLGKNASGNYVFSKSETVNGSGERGDFERNVTGEIEWIKGFDSDDCYDDGLSITGSSSTVKDGETLGSRTIKEPVIRNFDCKHPIAGVVETSGKKGLSVIDFGDGTCDDIAVVTKDGIETEIDLEKARERKGKRRASHKHKAQK